MINAPTIAMEDSEAEIVTLVRTLHETQQRLQELAGGELDAVVHPGGHSYMLHEAQETLRRSEAMQRDFAATQSSILNALPAHIALLDHEGAILSVNEGWRHFAESNGLQNAATGVGQNYLEVCDRAHGVRAAKAHEAATGIRAILTGAISEFAIEYPCHSLTEQRWFRLRVNPLEIGGGRGAVIMHMDITANKLAEEALRQSEASLATAQSIAHFGSWELDLTYGHDEDANSLRWSDEMFRIAGFAAGAIKVTNELFFRLVPPAEHEPIKQAVAKAIRERGSYSIVHHLIRPDGEERVVDERGQICFDEETGQPSKIIGTAHDITERKRSEEQLRENLAKLKGIFSAAPMGIGLSACQKLIEVNEFMCRMVGYSREELIGQDVRILYPTTVEYESSMSRYLLLTDGRTTSAESRYRCKDGRTIDVAITEVATAPEEPEAGVVFAVMDITERKRTQLQIAEQAALIDESRDAILVSDLEHRITFWSKGAERLYGWTDDEARGEIMRDLLRMDTSEFQEADRVVRENGAWNGEVEKSTRDGKVLTVDGRWTLIRDAQGQPHSILSINTDITERKKIELQFLRAQRMESIGTLAGGIAHDLNNSLAPILLSLELLIAKFPDPDSQQLLEIVSTSAKRGADLVRQVLSFARGVEGERLEVQLRHIVRDVEKIVNDTFLKHIEVRTSVPNDLGTVLGDATQLHQVLLNLCVNARDAMPQGGKLTITAQNVTLDAHDAGLNSEAHPGAYVVLEVEDSGTGIPKAILEKIFDPFFTTKEIGKGTGLGLSTSLAIVKSHGGFVRVYSKLGKGTTFKVYLPSTNVTSAIRTTERVVDFPRGHGELILVIDDEPLVRLITLQILEAFGYRVVVAADGAEGVATYATRGSEISAVITDMTMPIMDGPATIQALRTLSATLPIIAASGFFDSDSASKFASLGMKHFLPKPYRAETLLKVLRETLNPGSKNDL